MKIIIFDVEHGLCAFVLSPNGYTLMIDCGRTAEFSPVEFVLDKYGRQIEPFEEHRLAHLIISHPHNDHLNVIQNIVSSFKPRQLTRPSGFDWSELREPGGNFENLDTYEEFQSEYVRQATTTPDWGFNVITDINLSVEEAKRINETNYVNNTSVPVIIECNEFKIVFPGDLMQDGWDALLQNENFAAQLSDTTIFVASHHGHTSGFSSAAYAAMGKPLLNIVSAHKKDESVDGRYSSEEFAHGLDISGKKRRMISTRFDGSIIIEANGASDFSIHTANLFTEKTTLVGY